MIRSDTEFDLALVFISYGSVFRDIAEGLAKKGLKVIVFAPDRDYKNPDNTYSSEQASENLRIERIPVPRLDKNDLLQKLLFFLFFSSVIFLYSLYDNLEFVVTLCCKFVGSFKARFLSLQAVKIIIIGTKINVFFNTIYTPFFDFLSVHYPLCFPISF